jgi:hypothetical protein
MGGQGREKGSKNKHPMKPIVHVGETYGSWTILAHEGVRGREGNIWKCQCDDCGRIDMRTTSKLLGKWRGCRCGMIVADASFHRAFRTYRRQGKIRELGFDLSLEDFKKIVTQNCSYCGQKPALNSYSEDSKIRIPMNGIDRKDSNLGYTVENCIPCCGTCNLAKLDYPEEFFLRWAHRMASFQRNKLLLSVSREPGTFREGIPKPDEELELEGDGE